VIAGVSAVADQRSMSPCEICQRGTGAPEFCRSVRGGSICGFRSILVQRLRA
jgi:hypothetical protein